MMLLDNNHLEFGTWHDRIANSTNQGDDEVQQQPLDNNEGIEPVEVQYRAVYCHHQEDGPFWFELFCALVNRVLIELPGLRDFIEQHGNAIRNGIQEDIHKGQYRALKRTHSLHQLSHDLYTDYAAIYNFCTNQRVSEVLWEFDTRARRDRRFNQFKIRELLGTSSDDEYNNTLVYVYEAEHESIKQGMPVILKVFPYEHGEELFLNDVDVYEYLQTMLETVDRIWPQFFEFGSLTFEGGEVMYYLVFECIDGEDPNEVECRKCSRQLRDLGIRLGNDCFIKTFSQKVFAADLSFSEIIDIE